MKRLYLDIAEMNAILISMAFFVDYLFIPESVYHTYVYSVGFHIFLVIIPFIVFLLCMQSQKKLEHVVDLFNASGMSDASLAKKTKIHEDRISELRSTATLFTDKEVKLIKSILADYSNKKIV